MQKFLVKYEKYAAITFFSLMILCLIPMTLMGAYNHPLGDDYHYGYQGIIAWQETGNLFAVLKAAWEGMVEQFYIWQGTYSAMFLMHLPPHIWGDFFYKLYPTILLGCFAASVFYLMHVLLCSVLKASKHAWVAVSSLLVLVFIEQVPLCGESIYWYNGSMYYTGFLACTFVFWGMLIKLLHKASVKLTIGLSLMALFIAGGNYASLLPTMIILVLIILYYIFVMMKKKAGVKKVLISLCVVFAFLALGFLISVLAPGNALRQATSWKISPVKAVLKSIYQNFQYCIYWNGIWSILFLVFVTPIYLRVIEGCQWRFQCPIIVCGLMFGIYCSSSCPTFYAQNNGGAARVFCMVYYLMILTVAMMYFYMLGGVCRYLADKKKQVDSLNAKCLAAGSIILGIIVVLTCFRSWGEAYVKPHSVTALQSIINGEAAYYEAQYQERLTVLEDSSVKDVEFPAYRVPESLNYFLYLGDLSDDADNDVNRAIAEIYNKNSVRVKIE